MNDEGAECFIRRKGKGRSISLTCPLCGYTQYDIAPGSQKGSAVEVDCARCGAQGPVQDVAWRRRGER